jgi:hypothetical protein
LCEVIDGLVRARRQTDFGLSVKGLDDICALLTGRGEIAGMMLAKGLPDLLIGDLEADIQILLAEERVEKENSSE